MYQNRHHHIVHHCNCSSSYFFRNRCFRHSRPQFGRSNSNFCVRPNVRLYIVHTLFDLANSLYVMKICVLIGVCGWWVFCYTIYTYFARYHLQFVYDLVFAFCFLAFSLFWLLSQSLPFHSSLLLLLLMCTTTKTVCHKICAHVNLKNHSTENYWVWTSQIDLCFVLVSVAVCWLKYIRIQTILTYINLCSTRLNSNGKLL